jgi:hypothetical protein
MSELYIDQLGRVVTTAPELTPSSCSGCMYCTVEDSTACLEPAPIEHVDEEGTPRFCADNSVIYIEVKDE